jgi:hypothetical protein
MTVTLEKSDRVPNGYRLTTELLVCEPRACLRVLCGRLPARDNHAPVAPFLSADTASDRNARGNYDRLQTSITWITDPLAKQD